MIFPIGDDNIIGGHKPTVAYTLLAINVMIFIFQITLSPNEIEYLLTDFGIIPQEISQGQDLYAIITSMFLHGGLMHLLGNMLFLWIFADNIEAVVGNKMFLLFYLFGGIFAAIAHVATDPYSTIPTVGASGAISAVMGAYLVMFPKSRIKMTFLLFKSFYIPAVAFLLFWFIQQLFSGVGTYAPETAEAAGGVAWWAHIGGFVYGILVGWFFKQRYGKNYSYTIV